MTKMIVGEGGRTARTGNVSVVAVVVDSDSGRRRAATEATAGGKGGDDDAAAGRPGRSGDRRSARGRRDEAAAPSAARDRFAIACTVDREFFSWYNDTSLRMIEGAAREVGGGGVRGRRVVEIPRVSSKVSNSGKLNIAFRFNAT